ncbi:MULTISPECIES: hypothetical protein [Streptomyces]|uniref:Uncharacterized protein n=2 Tax=Streptomyces TaxID=1883 RepID=A0ABV9IQ05_9ACTN
MRAVDYADEAVSRAESIRAFTLVEGEFTEANGLLTPSKGDTRKGDIRKGGPPENR